MRIISILQRCTHILAAMLMCLLPVAIHAQVVDKTPVQKPAGVPKIVFESLTHDFGTVQPNKPLTHSFVFTNQGTAPLMIKKFKAG